ncbi:hypothetical protein LSCM1_00767 [Leishmania martiniquensis]|uniref:Uncharacterized protein n=1 Tax=Leishmania martiniquensis TaxID=1580590 RepID=A0A836FPF5_9TRYP|nr:hypothetical protein LSCM1_00767 [Leishmania martiniquensis]
MSPEEGTVRRRVRRLATMGEYELADGLVQSDREQREMTLSTAFKELERDGAQQWNSLRRAEAQCLLQQQRAALQEERAHSERILCSQVEQCRADEEELTRFVTSETVKLSTMPIAVPREVLVLQQQETQLRWEGSFGAAAQRRDDAARLERELLDASLSSRSSLLGQRITRQATALLTREAIVREKNDASVAALHEKHSRHRRRTAAQLRHVEDGMLAAQRRVYRRMQETCARDGASSATRIKTQRGAALERRVYGDEYRLPSLCELYGSLMESRPSTSPAR